MDLIVNLGNKKNIDRYKKVGVNHFIVGLKGFNVSSPLELDIDEISDLLKEDNDINLFVSLDKNIFNSELGDLKNNLFKLSKLNIKAVLFYDLSILNIVRENNLSLDLVWNQTHMVTNYNTCNYYYNKGVKYGYISSELTCEEIMEINKNSSMDFMVFIVGYPSLSHTRRSLLSNFYRVNDVKDKEKEILISERDKKFLIKENYTGTTIFGGEIVNGIDFIDKFMESGVSYLVLSDYKMDEDIFIKVLECIVKYVNNKDLKLLDEVKLLIGNNTHFFNKKTIYKVK